MGMSILEARGFLHELRSLHAALRPFANAAIIIGPEVEGTNVIMSGNFTVTDLRNAADLLGIKWRPTSS